MAGNSKLVYGIGVNDWDSSTRLNGKRLKEYELWSSMLNRCFNEKYKQKHPTYKDVTCSGDWLYMTKFIEDVSQMKGYGLKGWQLDKDILVKGNKLYNKDACCFVPQEVNYLLTKSDKARGEYPIGVWFDKQKGKYKAKLKTNGNPQHLGYFTTPEEAFFAYKVAKEAQIKVVAERWKNQLDERVYQALLNYTVEITD